MADPKGAAKGRIFYGSLENIAVKRDAEEAGTDMDVDAGDEQLTVVDSAGAAAIARARAAGNINIHDATRTEVMELSEESRAEQEKHAELLRRMEAERRARQLVVPTKQEDVRAALRKLGQPVRLFGEKVGDVRERLKSVLAKLEIEGEESHKVDFMAAAAAAAAAAPNLKAVAAAAAAAAAASAAASGAGAAAVGEAAAAAAAAVVDSKADVVYTAASEHLKEARQAAGAFSFPRTKQRLLGAKRRRENEAENRSYEASVGELYASLRRLSIHLSAIGDERPQAAVRASPDGTAAATGSWSSMVHVWDASTLERRLALRGHTERVTGLAWHPEAVNASAASKQGSGEVAASPVLLASAAADKTARLWDCRTGSCAQILRGHEDRLARVEFHPSGKFLGTASFDHTWRLWDCETGEELLLQDGHCKEVYSISFQADGGLVVTGDLGGAAVAWDIRSGKSICRLEGHIKRITCGDFSPNGFEVATGSDDNTVRVWDLRRRGCVYCLPAHLSLVSDVRYGRKTGEVLTTCGFDGSAKVWSTRDWSLLRALVGHDGKVSSCDLAPDERSVFTCGFDRTIKVWAPEPT